MNFHNSSDDAKVGSKMMDRKSNRAGQNPGQTKVDKAAMRGAQRGQDRMIKNENTTSGNTIFSK